MTGILDKKAATLSGGEKRKLCISIAFIGSPPLVILDEPTAGIDVNSRAIIWKTISRFNKTACFVTLHSLEEAETVSSRIFVMRAGEIIYQGTPSELRRKYNCGYRITSLGDISREEMMRLCREKNIDSSSDPDRTDSILIPVSDTVPDILSELYSVSQNIVVTVESLEHVILRMISEEEGG